MTTHQTTSAALLFAGFVLVYLWPVLVQGEVLSPRSVLFQFSPWATSAPPGWIETTSFFLGDVPTSHYAFHVIARDMIHDGVFPSWSDHGYMGVPFYANPQTVLLSPFALPIWVLPLEFGIGLSAALKLWVAAFGMYVLARELKLGFWPAALAGVSYGLSSFSVLWLTHETLLAVAAMLPWTVYLVERIVRGRGGLGCAILLTLAMVMIFTGGHPGAQVHVVTATGIYALIRVLNVRDLTARQRLVRFAYFAGATVVGAMIVALLLIPVVRSGEGTIGVQARIGENPTIPGAQLPLETIKTALFPDWWGRPSAQSISGPANYNERTFFAGSVATILALLALVSPGGWRRKAPFAVLGFIGLAVPLHFPGLYWLAKNLPLLEQVQHQRMMLLYVFAAAVLGAFGLQRLVDAPRDRRRPLIALAAAGGVGLVALAVTGPSSDDLAAAAGNVLGFRHAIGTLNPTTEAEPIGELVSTTVGWWLLAVAVVTALVLALWRWPKRTALVLAGVVAFAAVDVLYFADGYQPMAPAEEITPARTPAVRYLQRHRDEGRVTGVDNALSNDYAAAVFDLRDVRGAEPPQPTERLYHLWQGLVAPEQVDWAGAVMPVPSEAGMNALSVLDTRYVVIDPGADLRSVLPRLRAGYEGEDASVFVNPDAVGRTMLPRRLVVTAGETDTIETIASPRFRPRRDVIVERSESEAAALANAPLARGRVRVADESNARVTLAAQLDRPGLVVLNDALGPGWSVRVDGEPADAVRVNSVMRGVVVDEGSHEIEWSYRVPGLRLGLAVSAVGVLVLLGAYVVWWRRRGAAAATTHA